MTNALAVPVCLLATALLFHPGISMAKTGTASIYVTPTGNDSGDGSAAHPFKTLPRAQAAVRAVNAGKDVTVLLDDGIYDLSHPLIFTAADGGQGAHSVIWRAAPKATPLLSGGMTVGGFTVFDKDKEIYVADIPKGVDSRQLYVDDIAAERAALEIRYSDLEFTATGFIVKNPDLKFITQIKQPERLELEATGFFTDHYAPAKSVSGDTFTMQQPSWDNNTWGYDTISLPIFPQDSRLFLVNAPELLGRTNEWHNATYEFYIDPAAGKLYLRIPTNSDISKLKVILPRLESLVSIGGTLDQPVQNLTFKGLRFSYTSWMGPSRPTGYASQQSGAFLSETAVVRPAEAFKTCNWGCPEFETMRQKWNQTPAAVQVAAARNVTFEGNTFTQLGQVGLGIGNDANANLSGAQLATDGITVSHNRFAILAGGAIVAGGIRLDAHHPSDPRLTNKNLTIRNNVVTQVSLNYKESSAILSTYVEGARILHNDVSDTTYDGIDIGWGWGYNDAGGNPNYEENQKGYTVNPKFDTPTTLRNTEVAYNRIHSIKQWYMDGGAIYNLSANPGARIHHNYIYDIGDKIGIYVDEGSKHVRIDNNVVETRRRWLNANTVGKTWARKITTDNIATGNWHNSAMTNGQWIEAAGNAILDDHLVPDKNWPAEAKAIIDQAGVEK